MKDGREINVQELFMEAAIDNPTMFQGYTHYDNEHGFTRKDRDRDMDLFIEYVRMIEPKNPNHGRGGIHYPHLKWLEFRRRVDTADKDSEERWCLRNVFKEAAKITNLEERKKGKHYRNGLGFVETTEERREVEKVQGREMKTRSTSDKLQDATMRDLINSIRGYPFGEINMLGKDQRNRMKQFDKETEFIYRKNEAAKNEDDMWYLKEVFWEAAIDNKDLFNSYTQRSTLFSYTPLSSTSSSTASWSKPLFTKESISFCFELLQYLSRRIACGTEDFSESLRWTPCLYSSVFGKGRIFFFMK